LYAAGWHHVILSNHVPELPLIVYGLGLGELIVGVVASTATGYEKPHPRAFAIALDAVGGVERVWMVGDKVDADIRGAEAVEIPVIRVRASADHVAHRTPDL